MGNSTQTEEQTDNNTNNNDNNNNKNKFIMLGLICLASTITFLTFTSMIQLYFSF